MKKKYIILIRNNQFLWQAIEKILTDQPLLEVITVDDFSDPAFSRIKLNNDTIFVVDIELPDGDGLNLVRSIRSQYAQTKILALAHFGDDTNILNSLEAGANGYCHKSEISDQLVRSIFSLINDGGYLSGYASKVLIDKFLDVNSNLRHLKKINTPPLNTGLVGDGQRPISLTRKEFEVLQYAQKGSPAKIIADAMSISIFTVNQHLRSIYRKFNVHNKMEAVQTARLLGLL